MNRWARLGLGLGLCSAMTSQSFAAGAAAFGNEVISARAGGQGGVGVAAQSNDPGVVYFNPAGLTKLEGTQMSEGLSWENLHGDYKDDSGHVTKMRSIDGVVPNIAVTHLFMDGKLGAGLAVESPYGLETHWPGNGPFNAVATNSKLHMVNVSPAIGYQILPMVSLGLAADYYNVFDADLEKNLVPGGVSDLSGTGANWGYHTGLLIEPNEHHAFGLSYHSKVKLTIKGTASLTAMSDPGLQALFGGANYQTAAYTDLFLPQNIQLGYAFKPNDKWMFEADTGWYDWDSNRDVNVRFAETDPTRLSVLNVGNPLPLDRQSAWSAGAGANYKYNDRVQLRGGFTYLPSATPESTFTPSVIDLDRYLLSVGTGIGLTSALTLDFSYSAIFEHNRHVTNLIGETSTLGAETVSGTYENFVNVVMVNLTYRFK